MKPIFETQTPCPLVFSDKHRIVIVVIVVIVKLKVTWLTEWVTRSPIEMAILVIVVLVVFVVLVVIVVAVLIVVIVVIVWL